MKINTTLFIFLVIVLSGSAQQAQLAPQYTMQMLNKYNFNPAYAGLDNSVSVTGVFRKQWVGLEGSPTTQTVNFHMPLYYIRGGIGVGVESERLGAEQNISANISYNYWIPVNKTSILSLGIGAGLVQKSLNGAELRAPDGEYSEPGIFTHNDSRIPLGKETAQAPTVNIGAFYQSPKVQIGVSANNLLGTSFKIAANETVNIEMVPNYFFIFAGTFDVAQNISLHPSIFAKSDITQTQIEIAALAKYNGNIFGGVAFRGYNPNSIDALSFIGGFKLNEKVTLAYSYDHTLSGLNAVSNGSHEILINYNLNKSIGAGIPPKIIFNPRFL